MQTVRKYLFYLFRWQLSTPILAIVLWWLHGYNGIIVTIIANFIGGLIFFWVDRIIFKVEFVNPLWEIRDNIECADCGTICAGYRLVKTKNYDRINDKHPEFRCTKCSKEKIKKLNERGVIVE
jgi:cytochrome b subunit of formate dehydrogenase